jgi:tetratricopeptide (TPR) repeat protein
MDADTSTRLAAAREKLEREDFSGALGHEKAFAHLGLGELGDALECYDAAVALGNADADLWNDRAFTLLEMGDAKEAVASARKALELDGGHYAALCNMARAQLEMGLNEDAAAAADRAVELNPLEEDGMFLKAEAARRLGKREQAVAAYRKVQKINPHNAQAGFRLGQLEQYMKMDDVRRWDSFWERWSGLERLPFVIGFLLPGILLVALGALVPTIKGGNIMLFRAISISVGTVLILISAAVMMSGGRTKKRGA